jgi:hypothetical protein
MKIIDEINNVNSVEIEKEFVDKVESVYSCKLPEIIKHILCIPYNSKNYDEQIILKKLSNDMILEAKEEIKSNFIEKNLLPLFDSGDNDYICYDYANNIWCMFNTVNDSVFNKQENFSELF